MFSFRFVSCPIRLNENFVLQGTFKKFWIKQKWHSALNCFQIWSSASTDRFSTDDELKYTTKECLKEQSEVFYFIGIKKLARSL